MTTHDGLLYVDEIIDAALAAIDANPDSINPVDEVGYCIYQTKDGSRRCLVGEIAFRRGWDVPPANWIGGASDAASAFAWPLTGGAQVMLEEIQELADKSLTWLNIRGQVEALREL